MRPSQVIKFAREKAEEMAEKTGEVIGNGLMEGWGKAKGLGEDLKKELLRLYKKTEGNKMSEKKVGFRRISDEAVEAKTSKVWEEWFTILDTWGAKEKGPPKSLSISASTTDSVLGGLSRHHPLRVGKGTEEIDSHFES